MPATRTRSAGFTLVELLIVVIILGILAAVVIPLDQQRLTDAKESALKASLNTVRQAISLYRVQHDETYPGQASWGQFVTQLTTGDDQTRRPGAKYGPYLRTAFPDNPVTGTADGINVATMPNAPTGATAWIYATDVGELRANVAGTGPGGIAYFNL